MHPGEIYHLDNVPPPHRGKPKGRYVVLVTQSQDVGLDEPVFVVACSASVLRQQQETSDVVALPWDTRGRARTGFRRQTWAIPAWMLKVRPSQLGRRIGRVPNDKLADILDRLPPDPSGDIT